MTGPRCSCCYDDEFDANLAAAELRRYRRSGPGRASHALAQALARGGVADLTVLDIGAGIGSVHLELLALGAAAAVDADASGPYLAAARSEAERRGVVDRVTYVHGDAIAAGPAIGPADLVAMDRVACCYGDVDALVGFAAARTRRRLGIVVPPDHALARFVVGGVNVWQRIRRSSFRMYAHPHGRIAAAAVREGLIPNGSESVGTWRLLLFERPVRIADG